MATKQDIRTNPRYAETVWKATCDVERFFDSSPAGVNRVYERYNYIARTRDEIDVLDRQKFETAAEIAIERELIESSPFGLSNV